MDLTQEALIPLSKAARLIPNNTGRGHYSATSLWRWGKYGHRGVFLEMVRKPNGDWMTTVQAVERFLKAITALDAGPAVPKQDAPAEAWAAARLDQSGIGV